MQLSFIAWMILAGQIDTTAGPILPEGGCTEISRFLEEAVGENRLPGVVAIVANRNHVIYHGAFGKGEVARNVAMEKNDIVQIASRTKPGTSVAVMMLCEEGKLTLDDPLEKHLF